MRWIPLIALTLGMAAGCAAEPDLSASGRYLCDEDGGCPAGLRCIQGRCHAGLVFADPGCEACAAGCGAEVAACEADADCLDALQCVMLCGVDAPRCRAACELDHEDGFATAAAQAAERCLRGGCTLDCFGVGGFLAEHGAPCDACLAEACREELADCVASAADGDGERAGECGRAMACMAAPVPSPANTMACASPEAGAAAEAHRALRRCMRSVCPAECPFGRTWGCYEKYKWPRPDSGVPIAYASFFQDSAGAPVPDLAVQACRKLDCAACNSPVTVGTTDAEGWLELSIATSGGTPMDGCLEITGAGWTPMLHHLGRPLVLDERATSINMISDAEWEDAETVAKLLVGEVVPGAAQVAVSVWDCWFLGVAPGVTVELESPEGPMTPFYVDGSEVSEDPSAGLALFLNVPAGLVDITARTADGAVVGTETLYARSDWFNHLWLFPDPAP